MEKLSSDERIDILITDINMPGMDGYELAEKGHADARTIESDRSVRSRTEAHRLSVHTKAVPGKRSEADYGATHWAMLRHLCLRLSERGVQKMRTIEEEEQGEQTGQCARR